MQHRQRRLLELFRAESRESLGVLTAGALQVEQGVGAGELFASMYRAAHTVKGGARMLGLDAVASVAERAELVVRALRDGARPPDRAAGGELLGAIDELTRLIWGEPASGEPEHRPSAGPEHGSANGPQRGATAEAERGAANVPAGRPGAEPERGPIGAAERRPDGGPASGAPVPVASARSIRIPAERIDAVVALAAEARRAAETLAGAAGGEGPRLLAGLLATAESAALRLRLVPLEGIFADLRLAVRNAAVADGKEATLVTRGGEVEADTAVVDAASEIVLQLVRNAVAHGIEPPDERAGLGKPRAGRIELAVHARGGWLELTVTDDGRGVDEPALRARARASGLPEGLPTEELLYAPGVSTRRRADQLGGQGVGLDVVRARASAAGGEVSVGWVEGAGTTFVVRLPVTALYERLAVAELDGTPIGVPADEVLGVGSSGLGAGVSLLGDGDPAQAPTPITLEVEGPVDEASVLTVPLGRLFEPNRLFKRAWITADGRVGVVLEPSALA